MANATTPKKTDVATAAAQPQAKAPVKISDELAVLKPELDKVLPAHVSSDKFVRVVETALVQSPDLRNADRRSLFTSCVKCATDGLLPDGREAALVIFNTKVKAIENGRQVERWVKAVQYMPMVRGVLKLMRNSGELLSISPMIVHEADTFRRWTDDAGDHIMHEENLRAPDRGPVFAVYVVAKTKDGGVYIEVMTRAQVEKVRSISKSKDKGPWVDWWEEMAKKTVIRRVAKRMPLSTDIERVIERDDAFYNVTQLRQNAKSGTDAAKALLGLTAPADPEQPTGNDQASQTYDDGEGFDDEVPIYDTDSAIKALRGSGDLKQLESAWGDIVADFDATNRPLPVDIEAVHHECKEALAEAAKQQKK